MENQCKHCKQIKDILDFVKVNGSITKYCKTCYETNDLKWLRDKHLISKLKRRNRDTARRRQRRWNNWNWALYKSAQQRSREKHIVFEINPSDIIVPENCPVLGIKLIKSNTNPTANSPTLDRINPKLGYTKDNICVMSYRANVLKNDGTIEDHEKVISFLKNKLGFDKK